MITVDVDDVVELYDAGIKVLTEGLGEDAAEAFLSLSFGGTGDYTAEKQARPPMSDEELERLKDTYRANTAERKRLAKG